MDTRMHSLARFWFGTSGTPPSTRRSAGRSPSTVRRGRTAASRLSGRAQSRSGMSALRQIARPSPNTPPFHRSCRWRKKGEFLRQRRESVALTLPGCCWGEHFSIRLLGQVSRYEQEDYNVRQTRQCCQSKQQPSPSTRGALGKNLRVRAWRENVTGSTHDTET